MTPVFQDKFNDTFPHGGGNCLQAAVASLLDLPLEAVPHFMLFGRHWPKAFRLFLKAHGFMAATYIRKTPPDDGKYRIGILEEKDIDWSHAVILCGKKIVHDPKSQTDMRYSGYYCLTPYKNKSWLR